MVSSTQRFAAFFSDCFDIPWFRWVAVLFFDPCPFSTVTPQFTQHVDNLWLHPADQSEYLKSSNHGFIFLMDSFAGNCKLWFWIPLCAESTVWTLNCGWLINLKGMFRESIKNLQACFFVGLYLRIGPCKVCVFHSDFMSSGFIEIQAYALNLSWSLMEYIIMFHSKLGLPQMQHQPANFRSTCMCMILCGFNIALT